jgi:hypothetical protein
MRQIKVITTAGAPGFIQTDVTTFGQLKPLLVERNINLDNMKALEGSTKNEFSLDEALLPEGDFKLFLVPVKNKFGSDMADEFAQFQEFQNFLKRKEAIESQGINVPSQMNEEIDEDLQELDRLIKQDDIEVNNESVMRINVDTLSCINDDIYNMVYSDIESVMRINVDTLSCINDDIYNMVYSDIESITLMNGQIIDVANILADSNFED